MFDIDQFLSPSLRLILSLALIGMTVYVLYRSRTSSIWKEERDAALAKADRLDKENHAQKEELITLRAQTNLDALQKDNAQEHRLIVDALTQMTTESAKRHAELAADTATRHADTMQAIMGMQAHVVECLDTFRSSYEKIGAALDRVACGGRE